MSFIALAISSIIIGLIDSSDPIAYALIFQILNSKKSIRNFLLFLIPYFCLIIILGILLFYLGTSLMNGLKGTIIQDEKIFFYFLGGLIMVFGIYQFFISKKVKLKKERKDEKKWKFKLEGFYCSLSALMLFIINMPLFVLYAGLIISMIKAKIIFPENFIIILIYSLVLISPYIIVAILFKKYEKKIKGFMNKIFKIFENKYLLGCLLILIGLYLILG